jgi:hypothetical protein
VAPIGRVEVDPNGVYVEARFVHPDILSYAQNDGLGLDPLGTIQALIVAGIGSARSAGAYVVAEEARQAAESLRTVLVSESETLIRGALKRAVGEDSEEGGFLPEVERIVSEGAKSVETQARKLTTELTGAGEDALPQLIEKRVRRAARETVETILAAALASDGALGVHLANNIDGLKGLREDLSNLSNLFVQAKIAAEHIDPAAAGREWQPSVIVEIARLSLVTGDRVEETGDSPAHGRSKKGDAVLHLANGNGDPALKVAIECRTGKERLTINDLRKAKENRSAEAALLLAERACALPKDAEELGFRLYWEERAVVLHHDPTRPDSGILLATALQVARMFAQLAAAASAEEIDQDLLRQSLGRIERSLGRLKPLRASATGIETEVGRIRGYAQDIEGELRGALGELSGLIG